MKPAANALRARLDELLARRDRAGAVDAAVSAVRAGDLSVLELYDEVVTPLLVDTGTRWQQGATQVWEEHFASSTMRTIIESLYLDVVQTARSARANGRTVLLACPPHEQHDLGLRMLADRFAVAGWNVVFLGTDTPVAEIIAAARSVGAALLVLSASTHFNRLHLRNVVDELKAALPDTRVAVGGPAFALDREWPADEMLSLAEIDMPAADGGA